MLAILGIMLCFGQTGSTGKGGEKGGQPLSIHPDNPHYFLFRDQPTVLITSAEHYGSVLNLDFDYIRYLDTLAACGLNNTRIFSGVFCGGNTRLVGSPLTPAPGRLICPWARSDTPGYANGGNKFDLDRWDEAYFERLAAFVTEAGKRGIVVELALFCPFYADDRWKISPMNAANNVNGIGKVGRKEVYTLEQHGGLLAVQERLTRKLVAALNAFDNLYFEVCNEPYFGGITQQWHDHMAEVIVDAEKDLPKKHLISWNVANKKQKIRDPHPAYSFFNFHYATPPETVAMNYDLDKPIGDNETGFKGTADRHYRMEGWEFILAGGALYNHLDYSFSVGYEDGTFEYPDSQVGGGSVELRRQIRILSEFINGFDFVRMRPDTGLVRGGVPRKARVHALVEPGKQYALYLTFPNGEVKPQTLELELSLPQGEYRLRWLDPVSGESTASTVSASGDGSVRVQSPEMRGEIALEIRRK